MVAAVDSDLTTRTSSRIMRFNPSKPESWSAFEATLNAVASEDAQAALASGAPPIFAHVRSVCGPNASDEDVLEAYESCLSSYEKASSEIYKLAMMYTDFSSGARARRFYSIRLDISSRRETAWRCSSTCAHATTATPRSASRISQTRRWGARRGRDKPK